MPQCLLYNDIQIKSSRIMNAPKFFIFLLLLSTPFNLYAYIDPGSGGALITAILGFFAAIVYSVRKFFYDLRSKFKKNKD